MDFIEQLCYTGEVDKEGQPYGRGAFESVNLQAGQSQRGSDAFSYPAGVICYCKWNVGLNFLQRKW